MLNFIKFISIVVYLFILFYLNANRKDRVIHFPGIVKSFNYRIALRSCPST